MAAFSCTKNSVNLRSTIYGITILVSLELIIVSLAIMYFSTSYWRIISIIPFLILFFSIKRFYEIKNAAHLIENETLYLNCGSTFRAVIPKTSIISITKYNELIPNNDSIKLIKTKLVDDTIFVYSRKTDLIKIVVSKPIKSDLRGKKIYTSNFVINVDEPEKFLQELTMVVNEENNSLTGLDIKSKILLNQIDNKEAETCHLINIKNQGLIAESLQKKFGSFIAVSEVDLEVLPCEIHGLLGRNGAGKTTTVKMIVGLLPPDKGTIKINSCDLWVDPLNAKLNFGFVPDSPLLYERLSGYEHLQFIGGLYGLSKKEVDDRAKPLLERIDLLKWIDRPIHTYSAGTKRKLSIVSSLLHNPKVIILDEFTNTLDAVAIAEVKQLLQDLKAQGIAILITTHVLSIAEQLCDRITIINKGKIVAQKKLSKNDESESLESLFLHLTN